MTRGCAIEIDKLVKRFDSFTAVDQLTLSVPSGEIFGLLGPNGAGKTTTIRMLLGLMRPTSGTAQVLGLDSIREACEIHSRVGYMSQLFTLYRELTAAENIEFYGRVYGLSRRELAVRQQEVIGMAGLTGRADQVTAALRAYLEASRAYIGQMQALEEKYPELNDEVPATLENLLEELEEVMMRLQSSMMKLADYADDPELGKVMEEFQNLMM